MPPEPSVFLSAATVDLKKWREVLDGAFRRAGFRVLTQDRSLRSAPGDVKRLLTETIADSDCIIHLAGMGYGWDAADPFPDDPAFRCSWTQFEYYHGHREKKGVIGFVCAPDLSRRGFVEEGDAADIAGKQRLQEEHRKRVATGQFDGTPLAGAVGRTLNEPVDSVEVLLTAVAAAVGTLHRLDAAAREAARREFENLAAAVGRVELGVDSANAKLDANGAKLDVLVGLVSAASQPVPFQLPPAASRYFGRADLVADLAADLRGQKRTDVWGGPGMGKTALAAEAVARVAGRDYAALPAGQFPHGLVYLDLYQNKTPDAAWGALANAFDALVDPALPARQRAARACAHRRALVVLEGAEQLEHQLGNFLTVLAPETTVLVLTRAGYQADTSRCIRLDHALQHGDALDLIRHLAGPDVPQPIIAGVQARLGGHPLALTWAGKALRAALEPPADYLHDLTADPFTALTEPGGNESHTLRWQFNRSVRLLAAGTVTVLAAVARVAEPFDAGLASVAGGSKADLKRLVELSFLRAGPDGWRFGHALAAQYAGALPLPQGLPARLGTWAVAGLASADAACAAGAGVGPLDVSLAHATSLLAHDDAERMLRPVASALLYHGPDEGTLGIRRGRLDFARRALEAVRRWQEQAAATEMETPAWQREFSVVHNRLGDLAVAQGDGAGALRYFTQDMAIAERLAASDPANAAWQRDLSVSLNKLGDLAVAQGDGAGALRYFTQSKTIAERLAASDPANAAWQRDLSVSLNKLGDLAVAQGDGAGALRYFTQSKTIRERLAASDPANAAWQFDLGISNERLGDLAVAQGRLDEALVFHTRRKNIIAALAASDPANAAWQRDLSVSLNKLGDLAVAQGDGAGALRYFTESKTIRERLAASDPANAAWQRDLSVSLNKLGDLAVAQGDGAGALGYFTQSKTIAERLVASDPANAAWQRDLSVSLNKLGDLAVAQGDGAGALRYFTESHAILERLAASDPANAAWQRDLSVSLEKLGDLAVAQGDGAGALRYFTESKTIRERLAASDPANAEWQRDLSVSLEKLGDLAVAQGDGAGALRYFTQGHAILERLAASDPANAAWQRDLSVSLIKLGDLAVAQGDGAGALRYFTQSKTIAERLAASDPANAEWQRDLWVSYWQLANLCEKDGKAAEAGGWWRRAHDTLAGMKERRLHISPADERFLERLRAKVTDA